MTERELERRAKHKLAVLKHVEQRQRLSHVPLLRHQPDLLLQVAQALRGGRLRGAQGPLQRPPQLTEATQAEVVEKILWRRQRYHFGPGEIAMYLQRHDQIKISPSGVWRILHKAGVNRLSASQRYQRCETRWKRYEKQRPGHQQQVDVKFIEPLGQKGRKKRYYQYTAIDDCTRLRVLRAYPRNDQPTAIAFIDHVLSELPFAVDQVQTDNGQEFGSACHWHLVDKGIDTSGSDRARRDSTATRQGTRHVAPCPCD